MQRLIEWYDNRMNCFFYDVEHGANRMTTTMTLSFRTWCLRYHREIYSLLMFGHTELLTDEMKKEYVEWCRTDEGKKYLEGGEEYERRIEKRT